jgi:colanic acid biosynthesis protein WcaH
MKLNLDQFKHVVDNTVLVSLDLLLINQRNQVLVGRRLHAPARGYLFVPGGRIHKGETVTEALMRIAAQETGLCLSLDQVVLHGIYDHIYTDSFFEEPAISTQYVVIACRYAVRSDVPMLADEQHENLCFMPISELLMSPEVHPYTKNYFREAPNNSFVVADPCSAGAVHHYTRQQGL